jgi:hypothetical protein
MLIMECSVKWLIWMLKFFKKYFGLKFLFIKEFWWEKNWDDINWLCTLRKNSKFESCEI